MYSLCVSRVSLAQRRARARCAPASATLARRLCALIALARYVHPAAGVVPGVVVGPVGVGVPGGRDARVAPANGAIGSCVGDLAHGESCAPSCDEVLPPGRARVPRRDASRGEVPAEGSVDVRGVGLRGRDRLGRALVEGARAVVAPSEWDDPEERAPHVALHDAAMAKYTELLEKRQGSAY